MKEVLKNFIQGPKRLFGAFLRWYLWKYTEMYGEYKATLGVFKEPELKFGFHRNTWFKRETIFLAPEKYRYCAQLSFLVQTKVSSWETCSHRVGDQRGFIYAWKRPYRLRLRKMGLGKLPAAISVPSWILHPVSVTKLRLGWKTKYGMYRFETRPYFEINMTLFYFRATLIPKVDKSTLEDFYWDTLLRYIYREDDEDLEFLLRLPREETESFLTEEGKMKVLNEETKRRYGTTFMVDSEA